MVGFAEGELASLWRLCVVVLVAGVCGLWVMGFCGFRGVMFVVLEGGGVFRRNKFCF